MRPLSQRDIDDLIATPLTLREIVQARSCRRDDVPIASAVVLFCEAHSFTGMAPLFYGAIEHRSIPHHWMTTIWISFKNSIVLRSSCLPAVY
jgi:hypothetical protein